MYKPQEIMKPKKLKLQLNKETIKQLSEKQLSMINGGVQYAGTGYSDNLCQNTAVACVSKDVKCPTKVVAENVWENIGVIRDTELDVWFDDDGRQFTDDELRFWE